MELHSNPTIYAEMKQLNEELLKHSELYHVHNQPIISDEEYDIKAKRWQDLEEIYPDIANLFVYQQKPVPIHEPTNEGLSLVKFDIPMLSLKKALSLADIEKFFDNNVEDINYFYEYKLDGLALELLYINRSLVSMHMRGDGLVGEDVTHALPLFSNIPTTLPVDDELGIPDILTVRGEGSISLENFRLFNETAIRQAATPRNAVSGWVRALEKNQNPNVKGLLSFHIYWSDHTFRAGNYESLRGQWINAGFNAVPEASWDCIKENLISMQWPVDGIVIKIDDFVEQSKVGENNKYPLWAIAYKFPFEEGAASLEQVTWNTGKTGRVTPRLTYSPVKLGGVTCRSANLDNYYQFMLLELREDTLLGITRNGDVIPRVNRILDRGVGNRLKAPEACSSCGSILERRVSKISAELVCNNVSGCPSQLLNRCIALVGKRCLDIDSLGPVLLGALIEGNKVTCTSDILSLLPATVGNPIFYNILNALNQPLDRLIKALGLPGVDLGRAKKIARALPPSTDLVGLLTDINQLVKIPGISVGVAVPIVNSFKNEDFAANANTLIAMIKVTPTFALADEIKCCITGEMGQPRETLVDHLADYGIDLVSNLTKDCKFLIVGEKPGKSKLLKATELGIDIVDATKVSSIDALINLIKGV